MRPKMLRACPLVCALFIWPAAASSQMLETETSRLIPRHNAEFGSAIEYQTSSGGRELAIPTILGVGLTDRFELTLEPVLYTAIRPATGATVRGVGDLEGTATFQLQDESTSRPAIAVAGEVKLPTARNNLIGTGKTDLTGYLIASKLLGRVDTHYNIGYSIVGQPKGVKLRNTWNAAVAAVVGAGSGRVLFGELLAVTASASEAENGDLTASSPVPEAAGAELVGTVGLGGGVGSYAFIYGGISYDNNSATQLKIGMTICSPFCGKRK